MICLVVALIGTALELYLLYLNDWDFDRMMYNDKGDYGKGKE